MTIGFISESRAAFHRDLLEKGILSISEASEKVRKSHRKHPVTVIGSNADVGSYISIRLSLSLMNIIARKVGVSLSSVDKKHKGQTLGHMFEDACRDFIDQTFQKLDHLRPGKWQVKRLTDRFGHGIGNYEQYSHLKSLSELAEKNAELKTFLGDGYTVAPDIVILRSPATDEFINARDSIVDGDSALHSALRAGNQPKDAALPLLHASLSCKFTMRSDRAQNSRTEALNLLRSRKGRAPHIASITAEPTPSRIASLALGTGDLDCVYHIALYELRKAIEEAEDETALDLLDTMVKGKRLRDISDLPLDLAI